MYSRTSGSSGIDSNYRISAGTKSDGTIEIAGVAGKLHVFVAAVYDRAYFIYFRKSARSWTAPTDAHLVLEEGRELILAQAGSRYKLAGHDG